MRQPPKTYEQALAEMIRLITVRLDGNADLVEGSKLLSLAEAVAFQVADLSERQEQSISLAIPEAVYEAFGFARHAAQPAAGSLVFRAPSPSRIPVLIPAGTEVSRDDGVLYTTLEERMLEIGEREVEVPAVALVPGASGNTTNGTITTILTPPPGIQSVGNPQPFTGGIDAESEDEQRARFATWIDSLDESSIAGLTSAIMNARVDGIGGVAEALVVDGDTDPQIPAGEFYVYLYRKGGVPEELQNSVIGAVNQRRAAGCIPTYHVVQGQPVSIDAVLTVSQLGAIAHAQAALEIYFAGLKFGEKASRENLITVLTTSHPDILEVTLNSPAADVMCGPRDHLELGAVAIEEESGTL